MSAPPSEEGTAVPVDEIEKPMEVVEEEQQEADEHDLADGEEKSDGKAPKGEPTAREATAAAKEVGRKLKSVEKLREEKESLAHRVKANREALRVAEQELEALEAFAKKKARIAAKVEAEKKEEHLRAKATVAKSGRAKVNLSLKVAKQRVEDIRTALASAQNKAFEAARKKTKAQASVDDAMQKFELLKAQGTEVPDDATGFRDLSAPGSWKPPGVLAAKAICTAKAILAKTLPVVDKADATLHSCEQRLQTALGKFDAAKQKHKVAEERKQMADSALADAVVPKRLKAKPLARVMKAILKTKPKVKAKVKAKVHAKKKPSSR